MSVISDSRLDLFEQKLTESRFKYVFVLWKKSFRKEAEGLDLHLYKFFTVYQKEIELISRCVRREAKMTEPTELLRSSTNSLAVCLLNRFLADSKGSSWLSATVGPFLKSLLGRRLFGHKQDGIKLVAAILEECEKFAHALSNSVVASPLFLRVMFLQLKRSVGQFHPTMLSIVPASFFLHVICPALLRPPLSLNITIAPETRTAVMLSCKVLQSIANTGFAEDALPNVTAKVASILIPMAGLRPQDSDAHKVNKICTKSVAAINSHLAKFCQAFTEMDAIRAVSMATFSKAIPTPRDEELQALNTLAHFCKTKRISRLVRIPLPTKLEKRPPGVHFSPHSPTRKDTMGFVDDDDGLVTSEDDALVDFEVASAASFISAGAISPAMRRGSSALLSPKASPKKKSSSSRSLRATGAGGNDLDDSFESVGSAASKKSAKSDGLLRRLKDKPKSQSTYDLRIGVAAGGEASPFSFGPAGRRGIPLAIQPILDEQLRKNPPKKDFILDESELGVSVAAQHDTAESRTDVSEIPMFTDDEGLAESTFGGEVLRKARKNGKKKATKKRSQGKVAAAVATVAEEPIPDVPLSPATIERERRLEEEAERFLQQEALEEERRKEEQAKAPKESSVDRARKRVEQLRQVIEREYVKQVASESSKKRPNRKRSKSRPTETDEAEAGATLAPLQDRLGGVDVLMDQVVDRIVSHRGNRDHAADVLSESADSDEVGSRGAPLDELELDEFSNIADDVLDDSDDDQLNIALPNHLLERNVKDLQGKKVSVGNLLAKSDITIVVLLRHFGCLLCRRFISELWQAHTLLSQVGARILAVGFGEARYAHFFREDTLFDGEIYIDELMHLYNDLHCKRGWRRAMFNKTTLARIGQGVALGYRQGKTTGDFLQLGGVFVVRNGSRIVFQHLERFAGDHPELSEIFTACSAAHLVKHINITPIRELRKNITPPDLSSSPSTRSGTNEFL